MYNCECEDTFICTSYCCPRKGEAYSHHIEDLSVTIQNICVGICKIHEQYKICKGCYRSRLEIAKWMNATDEQKISIIAATEAKRQIYGAINDN